MPGRIEMIRPSRGSLWTRPARASMMRHVARLLLVLGAAGLGYWSWSTVEARLFSFTENRKLDVLLQESPSERSGRSRADIDPGLVGRIEIPRVGVSAIIMSDVDDGTLQHAIGHIPGTANFGEPGNVGLAGHRDSVFRGLRGVGIGDTVRVTTLHGDYEYIVRSTQIVSPDAVQVLQDSSQSMLTLVTCYPFGYIGHAPRRFIVQAAQVGARSLDRNTVVAR